MASDVFMIKVKNGDPDEVMARKLNELIDASGVLKFIQREDYTGIKIHFGEEGNTGHIKAEWLKGLVERLRSITNNIFFTDTNVLYKQSKRTNAVDHLKLAYSHGFDFQKMSVPVIIADGLLGRNYTDVEINRKRFSRVKVASGIADCDSLLALTHITGHIMTGFAGAIKNIGMGCASRRGKFEQHCGVVPDFNPQECVGCGLSASHSPTDTTTLSKGKAKIDETNCIGCGECVVVCKTEALNAKWSETLANLQEKMVEYACGAIEAVDGKIGYVNFLTNITRNCDCLAKDEPRIVKDVGILASSDIVSIDSASANILNSLRDSDIFKQEYPEIDWTVQLRYAASLGLGDANYNLRIV